MKSSQTHVVRELLARTVLALALSMTSMVGCSSEPSASDDDAADVPRRPVANDGGRGEGDVTDVLEDTESVDTEDEVGVEPDGPDVAPDSADVADSADAPEPEDTAADADGDTVDDVARDIAADLPGDTAGDPADVAEDLPEEDSAPDIPSHTPLDPNLDTPPESNAPCTIPGSRSECGPLELCRHFSAEESRCESCDDGTCNGLNQACSSTSECDILFTCYFGRCTGTCDLTIPQTCGNPADCTDVGHPTHGVCMPR